MADQAVKAGRTGQRDKIIRATAQLLRQRGFAATGLADIIETSGAPKGSLYHYFPGGKDDIAVEALRYAGEKVRATLTELAGEQPSAAAVMRRYGAMVAGWLADSKFRDGCPIATTLLETAAGVCEGAIAAAPAGAGGFGYDPVFLLPERGLTMAQLAPEEKHRISHRGRALRLIAPAVREALDSYD